MYPTQVTALAVLQGGSVIRALHPTSVKQNRGRFELQVVQQFLSKAPNSGSISST